MDKNYFKLQLPEFNENDDLNLHGFVDDDESTFSLRVESQKGPSLNMDFKSRLYKKTLGQKILSNWQYGALAVSIIVAVYFAGSFQEDMNGSNQKALSKIQINDLSNHEPLKNKNQLASLSMETDLVDLLASNQIPEYCNDYQGAAVYNSVPNVKKSNNSWVPFKINEIAKIGEYQSKPEIDLCIDPLKIQKESKKEFSNAVSLLRNKSGCTSTIKLVDNKVKISEKNILPAKEISEEEALKNKFFMEMQDENNLNARPVNNSGRVYSVENR